MALWLVAGRALPAPGSAALSEALTARALEQIVARAQSAPRLSHSRKGERAAREGAPALVEHAGRAYKVRAYPDEGQAVARVALLDLAGDAFPPCHGRSGRHLVFTYLEAGAAPCDFDALGAFCARLAAAAVLEPVSDFEGWCDRLVAAGMFRAATGRRARRAHARAPRAEWGLEYLDVDPVNFVCRDGAACCIDEKHLAVAPRGAGTLLPERKFPDQAEAFRAAYERSGWSPPLDDRGYRRFVTAYHLAYLLAEKSARSPLASARRSPQLHAQRRDFLRAIGAPPWARAREEIPWLVAFRWARARKELRRRTKRMRRALRARR
ncbi:MAG: hypothetical protein H0T43_04100 [Solirubrobacterales bacterium]|nr:hypothetical protein [Solirubrobacterales bacterium]